MTNGEECKGVGCTCYGNTELHSNQARPDAPTNSEVLFQIARAINQNAHICKSKDALCQCVAIDALQKMNELGLLNVRGEEIVKWVN